MNTTTILKSLGGRLAMSALVLCAGLAAPSPVAGGLPGGLGRSLFRVSAGESIESVSRRVDEPLVLSSRKNRPTRRASPGAAGLFFCQ